MHYICTLYQLRASETEMATKYFFKLMSSLKQTKTVLLPSHEIKYKDNFQ